MLSSAGRPNGWGLPSPILCGASLTNIASRLKRSGKPSNDRSRFFTLCAAVRQMRPADNTAGHGMPPEHRRQPARYRGATGGDCAGSLGRVNIVPLAMVWASAIIPPWTQPNIVFGRKLKNRPAAGFGPLQSGTRATAPFAMKRMDEKSKAALIGFLGNCTTGIYRTAFSFFINATPRHVLIPTIFSLEPTTIISGI